MSDKESEPESIILNGNAYNEIRLTDVKEIQIIGDGKCLFRCLSLFKDETQKNYNYYRQLIFNYINSNKSKLKIFFLKDQKNLMKITQLDIMNLYFQLKKIKITQAISRFHLHVFYKILEFEFILLI